MLNRFVRRVATLSLALAAFAASAQLPAPLAIGNNWRMQSVAVATDSGAVISKPGYDAASWYSAVVPGTILTTLVKNKIYPEPLYGENNRPEVIPETLNKTPFWYRTTLTVPAAYAGRHVWLNFDGINYAAVVWVNGTHVGEMRGAFARGRFDISAVAHAGSKATLAVLVSPQPHPGVPHEHTLKLGLGQNGGVTALDGPTFLSTIGWDWLPAIRDRDTGIWQRVYLSATGDAQIKDPLVTTTLPLPRTDSAVVKITATVQNLNNTPLHGTLHGTVGGITFAEPVELAANESKLVTVSRTMQNPKLWWPNGYGPQNLYKLHLTFDTAARASDSADITFGVRQITYAVPDSDSLTVSVNGVKVFIRGGDWGLDEAMKRIPRARLEAQIRMHALANLNMIRNWVGQSTSEDFYELCDKYGILLWDEFFQPNPSDGPNPEDMPTYLANVREKIVRYRNHPSIAIWCARNEGYPPKDIDEALRKLMAELEPVRLYQPSSTEGRGVNSGGPYHWRAPQDFYTYKEAFKTEIGSVSVPTLDSIHGMMPRKDWEVINDDWAEHDFGAGASESDKYPGMMSARYGAIANLADFARKGQLMNYEAYRAMYEGRSAKLFSPETGVIIWMSHPAQPSFVWQLYHYDFEPNASFFAVKNASEQVHIQLNEATGQLQVINNTPSALDAIARVIVYALDGSKVSSREMPLSAAASAVTTLGEAAPVASQVQFVQLELLDAGKKTLSRNFYWRGASGHPDDLTMLNTLPKTPLTATMTRTASNGEAQFHVTLTNPTSHVALMAHLQLRRAKSGERVLPVFYSDNYVSLAPGESRTLTITCDPVELQGEAPLLTLDGWNVTAAPNSLLKDNKDADPAHWPVTGLPFATVGLR